MQVSIDSSQIQHESPTFKMVSAFVSYQLKKQQLEENFSVSELHQLWIKAKNGQVIKNIPLHKARTKGHVNQKGYIVRPAPSFPGIEVVLFDMSKITRDGVLDQILKEVHQVYLQHPHKRVWSYLKSTL